jgi:hypothetical protein
MSLARPSSVILSAAAIAAASLAIVPAGNAATAPAGSPHRPGGGVIKVAVDELPLTVVGHVNLGVLAGAQGHFSRVTRPQGAAMSPAAARAHGRFRLIDSFLLRHRPKGKPKIVPHPATTRLSATNVPGEVGFSALGGVGQAAVSGFDLEPPDQGLCAGGGYVMEFINDAMAIYDEFGDQLLAPISSASAFGSPGVAFSDPRCYYDSATQRWFFQELTLGRFNAAGKLVTPSREYEAVSDTPDPTAGFTVYSWETTDASGRDCPCFGDYDNFGADNNGIYVSTIELNLTTGNLNGQVIYAISKQQLELGHRIGLIPVVFAYHLTKDETGLPDVVAPASSPPGTRFAPGTEYFVESNDNALSDNHLVVYALHDTSLMAGFAPPPMYRATLTSERYSFPSDAAQKPGPRPLGTSFQDPAGGIQADFDAEMEPTYAAGKLYAELDTGTASGTDAVDWFILRPALSGARLKATVLRQGTLAVKDASLLYPYTTVNSRGVGYLLFSLSGRRNFPSPAYVRYGANGPAGPVIEAAQGAAPNDSFGCYAAFVGPFNGGCRWGDYSMGAVMGGRVYMATEMIPQGFRDTLSNWGTFVWSAPPP